MTQFEHDSIVAHVGRVVQSRKKTKGKDAEPQLRVYVHLDVKDPIEADPVLSDLLDIKVADIPKWRDENKARFHAVQFGLRFLQRKVNFRYGSDLLVSMPDAVIDSFTMNFAATENNNSGLSFRIAAVSNGAQIGALSELIGTMVRLEVASVQGELELDTEAA